jgi:AcrR family transcriptional regulator
VLGQWRESRVTDARERTLAEAFVLFYAQGIRAVGVDLLVAQSGVAKASFYRHFPSKLALVVAYLERRHTAWMAWLDEEVTTRSNGKGDELLVIFDALADWFVDPGYRGCAVINAVAEVGAESPEVVDGARRHKGALRAYLVGLAVDANLFEPDAVGEHWALLVDGAMVQAQIGHDASPARAARIAAELLLRNGGSTSKTETSA